MVRTKDLLLKIGQTIIILNLVKFMDSNVITLLICTFCYCYRVKG